MAAARNPARGEAHYNAKLSDDDVRLVRACVAERQRLLREARELSDAKLAEKFGCHPNTIWKIASYSGRIA